jgi:hypothetical protein
MDYLLRTDTSFNNIILASLFINLFDYMCMNMIMHIVLFYSRIDNKRH